MKLFKVTVVIFTMVVLETVLTSCIPIIVSGTTLIIQEESDQILISEYDHIMRLHADSVGFDWRWLTAIAYQESRFQNDVRSPSGAVGIMQVMPRVALKYGVGMDEITDPEVNVRTAVKILKNIESMLRFGASTPEAERLKIILACYNGGIGHIIDARRLAVKNGANHNSWDQLKTYVRLKGSPEYVNDEAVRYGAFDGSETVDFVSKVMAKYSQYCKDFNVS